MLKYSVVIPVFNNEKELPLLLKRLNESLNKLRKEYELILVDDGSSDNSFQLLQAAVGFKNFKHLRVIKLAKNFGQNIAIKAGLDMARGEIAVILDADQQDAPESITLLIKKIAEGYEAVFMERIGQYQAFSRMISSFVFKSLMFFLLGKKLPHSIGTFAAIDRNILQKLKNGYNQPYIVGYIILLSQKIKTIKIKRSPRKNRQSGYNFIKRLCLAVWAFRSIIAYYSKNQATSPCYKIAKII